MDHPPATSPQRPPLGCDLRPAIALLVFLLLLIPAATTPRASAHPALAALVSHELRFDFGPTNLDLTLDLTFHEAASYAERRRMDRNRNGRLETEEVRQYLHDLCPDLELGLSLELASASPRSSSPRPIPLVLLHNPEIDLRDQPVVALATHVLRLRFFARTPPQLRPGCHLNLVNHLWDHLPATRTFTVSQPGAFAIESDPPPPPSATSASLSASNPVPSRVRLRCLAFP